MLIFSRFYNESGLFCVLSGLFFINDSYFSFINWAALLILPVSSKEMNSWRISYSIVLSSYLTNFVWFWLPLPNYIIGKVLDELTQNKLPPWECCGLKVPLSKFCFYFILFLCNLTVFGQKVTIQGTIIDTETKKTIEIFNTDGADCRAEISGFEKDKIYVISIYQPKRKYSKLPNETDSDYAIGACSENWLEYLIDKNEVRGYITGKKRRIKKTYSYEKLVKKITLHNN